MLGAKNARENHDFGFETHSIFAIALSFDILPRALVRFLDKGAIDFKGPKGMAE